MIANKANRMHNCTGSYLKKNSVYFKKKQSLKNIKNVVACLVDSLINVIIILYKPYFLQHQGFYFNSISTGDKIKKQEKKQRDIYFF